MSKTFERRSVMPGTAEQMLAFHSQPRAFQTLTPPPIYIQVLRDNGASLTQREILFRMWVGPIPLRWLARHEPGPIPTSFIDRMMEGPLAAWEHQHIFRDVPGGVEPHRPCYVRASSRANGRVHAALFRWAAAAVFVRLPALGDAAVDGFGNCEFRYIMRYYR